VLSIDRLKELEKVLNTKATWEFDTVTFATEMRTALPDLIRELEAGRKVEDEAECLITHPSFTKGTDHYDHLPTGITARAESLQEALAEYRRAREG